MNISLAHLVKENPPHFWGLRTEVCYFFNGKMYGVFIMADLEVNNCRYWEFPLKRYYQIWSQLTLYQSVLYRKVKTPIMPSEKLLPVAPTSLRRHLLKNAHDKAGHQGADRIMAWLSEAAYWVGMGKDVHHYCTHCVTCQHTKAVSTQPVPLHPVIASRPWELVAVDILKVPMSHQGNQYMLVVQDYFSKWPSVTPLDQTAGKIMCALKDQVFTLVGPPQRLHSDQGKNFESLILGELCKLFGVTTVLSYRGSYWNSENW